MPDKDSQKATAFAIQRQLRYRQKKHVEKFGPEAGDMRGRHGKQPRGPATSRWNSEKILSSHGYVKLRVGKEHPLADPNGYAYEHLLIWVAAGNERPMHGRLLHHVNENKSDNRLANLEILTRPKHAARHHSMLQDEQVRAIRERYAAGEDGTSLAAEFKVPHQRIYRFIKGETRRDAGGPISPYSLRKKAAGRLLDGVENSEFPEAVCR